MNLINYQIYGKTKYALSLSIYGLISVVCKLEII